MNYGQILKKIRHEKSLSQSEVSEALGISRITYSHYEVQEKIVPVERLNQICNYFNVSIDFIFGLTNIINYDKSCNDIFVEKMIIRLKEFRKENKLTQVKLASELNIGNGTIAEYERGNYIISTHSLYQICKKYKISADYLLGKIDSPKYLN